MKIFNTTRKTTIAVEATMADTAVSRMVGLLNRQEIREGEGLIITDCRSIHMLFMRFAIDVIFVDKHNKVVGLVAGIKPFQLSPYFFKSSKAIELPPGVIQKSLTQIGDSIQTIEL